MTAGDRRHPPQAEIMALMIELGGITQAAREELKAFREEREALLAKPAYIGEILHAGADKARKVAAMTLDRFKESMGMVSRYTL